MCALYVAKAIDSVVLNMPSIDALRVVISPRSAVMPLILNRGAKLRLTFSLMSAFKVMSLSVEKDTDLRSSAEMENIGAITSKLLT